MKNKIKVIFVVLVTAFFGLISFQNNIANPVETDMLQSGVIVEALGKAGTSNGRPAFYCPYTGGDTKCAYEPR